MRPPFLTPLDPDQQRLAGIDPVQDFAIADRVRYGELDTLNHVNNKAYLDWFEAARTWQFRDRFAGHFASQPRTVLRNIALHYREELRAGESYVVTAQVTAYRRSSYTLDQQVWSDGRLRTQMQAVMVMLGAGSCRMDLPDTLIAQFRASGAQPES